MAMRGGGVLVQLMAWGAGWACWVEAGGGGHSPSLPFSRQQSLLQVPAQGKGPV